MKTITLSVDEDICGLARITAPERNTTVSALVRAYLRTFGRPGEATRTLPRRSSRCATALKASARPTG